MKERKSSKMKRVMKLIFSSFIVVFLLSGCNWNFESLKNKPMPTFEPRSAWITEWLEGEIRPSCWMKICIGETRFKDVITELRKIPRMTRVDEPYESIKNSRILDIEFTIDKSDGVITSGKNGEISEITLIIDYGQYIKLDEVIKTYGKPTYVLRIVKRDGYSLITIIFIEYGVMVYISTSNDSDNIPINADSMIGRIIIFPSGDTGYYERYAQKWPIFKTPLIWKGYGSYEFPH